MSETQVEVRTRAETEPEEYDIHVYCCGDPSILLCGFPADGIRVGENEETTCVVCAELEKTDFCPRSTLGCDHFYLQSLRREWGLPY